MPEFKQREAAREQEKQAELAPYMEAALARKDYLEQLKDDDIPVFPALGRAIAEESDRQKSIMEKDSHGYLEDGRVDGAPDYFQRDRVNGHRMLPASQ